MVPLNVGGRRFDTTKETLNSASYFRPYLEGQLSILPTKYLHQHHPLQGRLDNAADEEGDCSSIGTLKYSLFCFSPCDNPLLKSAPRLPNLTWPWPMGNV